MENREIDRKIAELMGYEVFVVDGIECIETVYDFTGGEVHLELPEYSEDWNAMRLLVEWLHSKKYSVEIMFGRDMADVSIYPHDSYLAVFKRSYTPPLALCEAVLSLEPEVLK